MEYALEMKKTFLEIIAAPDFDDDALEVLEKKKNLRLLKLKNLDARDAKYDINDRVAMDKYRPFFS